jgi:hypothetical protein
MEGVKTYDPKKVIVTFGGNVIDGYADGTFVEVSPSDGDGFKKVVGADGAVGRSKSSDNTNQVSITLLQTSKSNDVLSTIRNTDKLTAKAIMPLSIVDLNGTSLFSWAEAWIKGDPTWSKEKEIKDYGWVFDTGQQSAANFGGLA